MDRKLNSGLSSGVNGKLKLENYELLNKLNEQAAVIKAKSHNLFTKDDIEKLQKAVV